MPRKGMSQNFSFSILLLLGYTRCVILYPVTPPKKSAFVSFFHAATAHSAISPAGTKVEFLPVF